MLCHLSIQPDAPPPPAGCWSSWSPVASPTPTSAAGTPCPAPTSQGASTTPKQRRAGPLQRPPAVPSQRIIKTIQIKILVCQRNCTERKGFILEIWLPCKKCSVDKIIFHPPFSFSFIHENVPSVSYLFSQTSNFLTQLSASLFDLFKDRLSKVLIILSIFLLGICEPTHLLAVCGSTPPTSWA